MNTVNEFTEGTSELLKRTEVLQTKKKTTNKQQRKDEIRSRAE